MTNRAQKRYRSNARTDLEFACEGLADKLRSESDLQSYREFLNNDEFRLALDELETLGRSGPASSQFWLTLSIAALHIGCREEADEFERLASEQAV